MKQFSATADRPAFCCFSTVPACDRQTYERTDRRTDIRWQQAPR